MNIEEPLSQIRWRPQIGDPTMLGWLAVAAYAGAAALCLIAAFPRLKDGRSKEASRQRRVWIISAGLMSFLCVNKQLDFHSLLTEMGRSLAIKEGWYDQRRIVQRWFVLAIAAAGIILLAILAWIIRSVLRERALLLLGLISLFTFTIIRAASFHHVQTLLGSEIVGIRLSWFLELGGISLVAFSAGQSIRRARAG